MAQQRRHRTFRLSATGLLSVTALLAVGIVSAGASSESQLDPITLCFAKSGVRVSADESCVAKETKVQVASAADGAALAARLDAVDDQVADLEARVAALETPPTPAITLSENPCGDCGPTQWFLHIEMTGLKPASEVVLHWETDGPEVLGLYGQVGTDYLWDCDRGPLYLTGTDDALRTVTSNTLWGAGCTS